MINSFDIDGVIYLGEDRIGLHPRHQDIIVTGRTLHDSKKTYDMLADRGITATLYLNPFPGERSPRETSGEHKARILRNQIDWGLNNIQNHYEDDPVQAEIIRKAVPEINVIMVDNNGLVEL